jgi:formylglycine-generating enzyme required for sulfatase activity
MRLSFVLLLAVAALADERANVEQLHARIASKSTPAKAQPYKEKIPGTEITFEMVPVPGGTVTLGGVRRAKVDPFWMGKYEVTWDEYRLFMFANQANEEKGKDPALDAVSRPTKPYVEMSFGMGINSYPAISMTQHAANKYAEWLSAKTGEFYRLPTEAEWEHACAGETASPDNSVFKDNSGGRYAKVGTKKPNKFGLYDMLGNVMVWTLDQYAPYAAGAGPGDSWVESKTPYPHSVRGGSWNDKLSELTCSARVPSDATWKQQDPQIPKSIWYLTDAQWVGFRLVRPLKVPSASVMFKAWNNGVETE